MEDRFIGSLLGLALGDALGAKHEGGPLGQAVWWALGIGKGDLLRWTDDTEMALSLAESLAESQGLDPDHLARLWAKRASATRGYGPGTLRLLRLIRSGADWREANRTVFPDGSFGNGAAMRAAPLGLFFRRNREDLLEAARQASTITHAHPLGIEGGVLIALATALALEDAEPTRLLEELTAACALDEYRSRLALARDWLAFPPPPAEVRKLLGASVLAHESAVTAVHAFLRSRGDFEGMVRFVIGLGGDTDTIAAMAGGIFGARHGAGALPPRLLAQLEARETIEAAARRLCSASRK